MAVYISCFIWVAANSAFASENRASSGRWVIYSERPAKQWQDGMPTGNGRHGMRVMGNPKDERII
ncbi:MAG: glycoside hydrolase N-terminal domain-containing protein, partial [Planctomycetota bacterium]